MNLKNLKKTVMLPIKYWFYIIPFMIMSNPLIARDLESIATNLTSKTSKIASSLVPIGFAIAAAFMAFGSPKGSQYVSTTLLAAVVSLGGGAIYNWLKGIVG